MFPLKENIIIALNIKQSAKNITLISTLSWLWLPKIFSAEIAECLILVLSPVDWRDSRAKNGNRKNQTNSLILFILWQISFQQSSYCRNP